jgi:hypothetical protein
VRPVREVGDRIIAATRKGVSAVWTEVCRATHGFGRELGAFSQGFFANLCDTPLYCAPPCLTSNLTPFICSFTRT